MIYGKFIDAESVLAERLSFLSKAVSKSDNYYFMKDIYVEPSDKGEGLLLGVASDTKRMHIVDPLPQSATEIYGMTPGWWRILRVKKNNFRVWIARLDDSNTEGWKFPPWRKVIPNEEAVYRTTFEGFSLNEDNTFGFRNIASFIHDFPDTTALNLDFLQDLGVSCVWEVEWYGHLKALKFTASDSMAVIMPLII